MKEDSLSATRRAGTRDFCPAMAALVPVVYMVRYVVFLRGANP
jgi:hypothetical protein